MNRLTKDLAVSCQRDGAHRVNNRAPITPQWTLAGAHHRASWIWTKFLPFVLLLGAASCKLRDTSGYCQCEKTCDGGCVATNDPRYGCASATTCAKCEFPKATATCDNEGGCAIGGCETGYADCDGDAPNGCETNYLSDIKRCGTCYTVCPGEEKNAESKCDQGLCVLTGCLHGFQDCNDWYVDGCETAPDAMCDAGIASSAQGN